MRVLVTGGAGYIGSVLTRDLASLGHSVRVVDCGFFGLEHLDPAAEIVNANILDFDNGWLNDIDAVIHLAGLSNDPMAAFSPTLNYLFNASGAAIVAHAAKDAGIHRFVFGSTCSVYGLDESGPLNEDHWTSPSFPYAISKLMAERMLSCLTDDSFRPIVLRKGTVVGWSPRMRFDLVVNTMIKTALTEGQIVVHNPALWRPLIDVEDASAAYIRALEAPLDITGVFNVSNENYQLCELAAVVAAQLHSHGIEVTIHTEDKRDVRSYRVTTQKASEVLNFKATKDLKRTVNEVVEKAINWSRADFSDPRYYNVRQFQRLLESGALSATSTAAPALA